MKITGVVSEVSKKPKSWKLIINKHNYYCKDDVNEFVGKCIEADYIESEPYANPTNPSLMITSKYIRKDTIKVIDGVSTPKKPETPLKTQATPLPVASGDVKPDWDAKDRRIARLSAWKSSIEYFRGNNASPEEMKDLAHYIEADVYRAGITPEQEEQVKIDSDNTEIPF